MGSIEELRITGKMKLPKASSYLFYSSYWLNIIGFENMDTSEVENMSYTTNYVSYKDLKKLMADLKMVYAAPDEATALEELESFGEKWNSKYPKIYKFWSERRATLSTYIPV